MTVGELTTASRDLLALARVIAEGQPEAMRAILDATDLIAVELLTHAFGGGEEARRHAIEYHVSKTRRAAH